ncbi:MAG: CopG family transcriptional regulator [Gemmatimonadota bacterium]|jgi:hypothetical protein
MIRTQIQVTEEQHRWLKRWARERGISLSEAVRRCVDLQMAAEATGNRRSDRVRRAMSVIGKYSDPEGSSSVGRDHDTVLADVYRG